jgi:3-deoxy-D-manno-octulosonate 8-phosphate phosphatase (KDO 8-P phosphatase)
VKGRIRVLNPARAECDRLLRGNKAGPTDPEESALPVTYKQADPAAVRLLVLDVDGVMTDGRIWVDESGNHLRGFCTQDGTAVRLWQRAGHVAAVVTAKSSEAVARRVRELDIRHYAFGDENKLTGYLRVVREAGCEPGEVCYVGDDVLDLAAMKRCGYPIAVANAVPEIRELAAYVTVRRGGDAAVREVVEHLLRAQGRWEETLARAVNP